MGNCPVCDKKCETLLCPECGFDGSGDYERFPTFARPARLPEAIGRRKALWLEGQKDLLLCEKCGGRRFTLSFSEKNFTCASCGASQPAGPVVERLGFGQFPPEPAPMPVQGSASRPKPEWAEGLSDEAWLRLANTVELFEWPDFEAEVDAEIETAVSAVPEKPKSSRICQITAGDYHTVVLYEDGTVAAVGNVWSGQRNNVEKWENMKTVAVGVRHIVGINKRGDAYAVGPNLHKECDVADWTEFTQAKMEAICAGYGFTVGLQTDGTLWATGRDEYGQCAVHGWKNVADIAAGSFHTVGLLKDGTVVAVGDNKNGQCRVKKWKDITAIAAGTSHTIGLCRDGTVVATGFNSDGQCKVKNWKDIVSVSAGCRHTVGLKKDGTVVTAGRNEDGQCNVQDWTDIVAISAGAYHTIGLRSDGTLLATGDNSQGQCDVQKLMRK